MMRASTSPITVHAGTTTKIEVKPRSRASSAAL
jgi:hypothetical protein